MNKNYPNTYDDDFDWTWDESVYQGDNSKGWVKVIEDSSSFS